MDTPLFIQYLNGPELLDDRSLPELKQITEEYPLFQTARLLYLKNLSNQGNLSYEKELRYNALWVTDRRKLFYLLDHRVLLPVTDSAGPQSKAQSQTAEPFDFDQLANLTFIDHEPDTTNYPLSPKKPVTDELDRIIMAGSAHLGTFFDVDDNVDLESFKNAFKKRKPATEPETTQTSAHKKSQLIDQFIREQPRIVPRQVANPGPEPEKEHPLATQSTTMHHDLITDTLAKIYIQQGNFEKAIQAYEKLSLKFPEKNSYFAGQIEKIKQLINNQ
jgi:tetratricopeptide (TPR) repeat protein